MVPVEVRPPPAVEPVPKPVSVQPSRDFWSTAARAEVPAAPAEPESSDEHAADAISASANTRLSPGRTTRLTAHQYRNAPRDRGRLAGPVKGCCRAGTKRSRPSARIP